MITLIEYIELNHNGNQSEFARAMNVPRSQVQQWLNAKKPVFVVNGKLVAVIADVPNTDS